VGANGEAISSAANIQRKDERYRKSKISCLTYSMIELPIRRDQPRETIR
jgi:hypothetical protein